MLTTVANVTLHFSGNKEWFSIFGPIFSISKFSLLSTKKITCGFPTFTAVPPENSFLFLSLILIPKLLVFNSLDNGISFHFVFAIPISVETIFSPIIFDFNLRD